MSDEMDAELQGFEIDLRYAVTQLTPLLSDARVSGVTHDRVSRALDALERLAPLITQAARLDVAEWNTPVAEIAPSVDVDLVLQAVHGIMIAENKIEKNSGTSRYHRKLLCEIYAWALTIHDEIDRVTTEALCNARACEHCDKCGSILRSKTLEK